MSPAAPVDHGRGAARAGMLAPKLTPRDLGDYRVCPRKVWFRRVAKAPSNQRQTEAMLLGNAVHAALYLFYGLPLTQRRRPEQRLHQCLRSVWKAHRTPGLFPSRDAERACGLKGLELLSRYAQCFSTDVIPVLRERWVQVRLANDVVLFGKADRVDPNPRPGPVPLAGTASDRGCEDEQREQGVEDGVDGEDNADRASIDVVDYKTGLEAVDEQDLPDEPAAQIYLLGSEATLKRPVRRVRIAYLAHGAEARWEPERDDVDQLRERLTDLTDTMIHDRSFHPQPGDHCTWCPYAAICPDAARSGIEDRSTSSNDVRS